MKTALDHPLVAHARTRLDATVRKVEPLRTSDRRVTVPVPPPDAEEADAMSESETADG
jgi:hypothetical protein